ncbi:uncharacterized protein LOC131945911 [Physella acuta]|uniref:uncharacterized protein LOC131945911 n=1 Tax=Physella acuta TaxID=109671 RepID=UPI0027DD4A5A|nr:uncharacterized protein LOC131945911 [Physella acuta]
MTGVQLSSKTLENNTLISFMGKTRQFIPHNPPTIHQREISGRKRIDLPPFYFANHHQVAEWTEAVGLGHFSSFIRHHLINGRKLLTLDALQLQRLGCEDMAENLKLEASIKDLSQALRHHSSSYDVLPYFYTQSLNSGRMPPRRYHRELFQFTDPWLTETYKFVNISGNDLHPRVKERFPRKYYSNSRSDHSL